MNKTKQLVDDTNLSFDKLNIGVMNIISTDIEIYLKILFVIFSFYFVILICNSILDFIINLRNNLIRNKNDKESYSDMDDINR